MNKFQPNWVSAPGETIADLLVERDIPLSIFANRMENSLEYVKNLMHGNEVINEDIAFKLEKNLGLPSDFWLRRDIQYREGLIRLKKKEEESWLKMLPINDMIKFGWIKAEINNLVEACLDYFDVSSISQWNDKFEAEFPKVAFRTSSTFGAQPGSVATWIHQGEKQVKDIICNDWNPQLFEETLTQIKQLTRIKDPKEFIPKLTTLCAKCGVALAIVRTPAGCPASGLTKFITPNRALLMLSFRYLTDDHFWFTFFHEAGHLILHNNTSVFVEEITKEKVRSKIEIEANDFAAKQLIPSELEDQLMRLPLSNKRAIIKFAAMAGVAPGIVIGQLQYLGRIEYKQLNSYKRRYTWEDILG